MSFVSPTFDKDGNPCQRYTSPDDGSQAVVSSVGGKSTLDKVIDKVESSVGSAFEKVKKASGGSTNTLSASSASGTGK